METANLKTYDLKTRGVKTQDDSQYNGTIRNEDEQENE